MYTLRSTRWTTGTTTKRRRKKRARKWKWTIINTRIPSLRNWITLSRRFKVVGTPISRLPDLVLIVDRVGMRMPVVG